MADCGARSLINGRRADQIAVENRGLAYGDGLFETIAILQGRPSLWDYHLHRLFLGCDRLQLPLPNPDVLCQEIEQLVHGEQGVLKILLLRCSAGRGYLPPECQEADRILLFYPSATSVARHQQPVAIRLCDSRLAINPQLAGIKHLNRLEQVLARAEWRDPNIFEGIMLDLEGRVVEGTCSNLFVHDGERWVTPRLERCGVAGVMRRCLMQTAAELGSPVAEVSLTLQQLYDAKGILLTNSLWGVVPVAQMGEITYHLPADDDPLLQSTWNKAFAEV